MKLEFIVILQHNRAYNNFHILNIYNTVHFRISLWSCYGNIYFYCKYVARYILKIYKHLFSTCAYLYTIQACSHVSVQARIYFYAKCMKYSASGVTLLKVNVCKYLRWDVKLIKLLLVILNKISANGLFIHSVFANIYFRYLFYKKWTDKVTNIGE